MRRKRDNAGHSEPIVEECHGSEESWKIQRFIGNARAYLKTVKDMLKDKKDKYNEFVSLMKDFKSQKIDTAGVIQKVKDLFKDHQDLILGFNSFLPRGYEITLEDSSKKQRAINFINKILTRFQHDEVVCRTFLEILNMFGEGSKSINEVYQEVSVIFKEHADLLEEFVCYLQDSSRNMHFTSAEVNDSSILPQSAQVEHKRDTVEPLPEDECSSEKLDKHNPSTVKYFKDQQKWQQQIDVQRFERGHKTYSEDHEEYQQSSKYKSIRATDDVKCTLQANQNETCVHISSEMPSVENKVSDSVGRELGFFDIVKNKLQNPYTYQDFLKFLNLYSKQIITREQLNNQIKDMFEKFPELIQAFSEFLTHCESTGNTTGTVANMGKELGKEKEMMQNRDGKLGQHMKKERDKHPLNELANHRLSNTVNCNKYMNKPISELDLTNCKQCTPSYRLLPENYPIPKVSSRTVLGNHVLNDFWVSVTSGSEEAPFKHMRKNQYEESLFRCEDDRFELDMLVESTNVTTRRLEELQKKMQDENMREQIYIDDYLTAIQLRCIERIYGDHGLDVLELLRKNLAVALPVVLNRLKQKQEEWLKCRADMNKVWAEVYAKNYHKSLDHRSLYFKQQDKKSLSSKVLLAEIKDANARNRKNDAYILSIASGNTRPLIPDLTLEYPDPNVNDDLYEIIKRSAEEICTSSEQADKIVCTWKDFLEPIFGASHGDDSVPPNSIECRITAALKNGAVNHNVGMGIHCTPLQNSMLHIETKCLKREQGELLPSYDEVKNITKKSDSGDPQWASSENPATAKVLCDWLYVDYLNNEGEKAAIGSVTPGRCIFKEKEKSLQQIDGSNFNISSEATEMLSSDCRENEEYKEKMAKKVINVKGIEYVESNVSIEVRERLLHRCKPLVAFNKPLSANVARSNQKLFYGNDNIYLLFRLHQALNDRIHAAKVHALAAEKAVHGPSSQLFQKFLEALYGLLDGTVDNGKFEDICRSIMGIQSYLLFTMDKLIYKLIRQLQAIASDETATKLLMLHAYEKSHPQGLVDAVYHANACMISHDENVYRFERRLEPRTGLFIQLMEVGSERLEVFANAVESSFAKYLDKFLHKEPFQKQEMSPLFLKRNKIRNGLNDEQTTITNALKNVDIVNGLEYKISCNSYTVSYVLDTEDFLHRKKRKLSNTAYLNNASKFHKWLDSHVKQQFDR